MSAARYAELQCTSHFSFQRCASSCEELFAQAATLGIEALAIVDRGSLAGIVRAREAAKATGVRLVVGARLDPRDALPVLVYPTDRAAYARLCRLLSLGKTRGGKGACALDWADLVAHGEGLLVVLVPDAADADCARALRRLAADFGDRAYCALGLRRRPNDALRLHELETLARRAGVPTIVVNDVLFHAQERRVLQDVVTCVRHNCTIEEAGFRRERHADRYLKPPEEMARLLPRHPDALARTIETREGWFFSRSRQRLLRKGEESGNTLAVAELRVDCDQDAILLKVRVAGSGVVCHTGHRSCFYRSAPLGAAPQPDTALAFDLSMPRG